MPTYNSEDWQNWMRAAQGGDAAAYRKLLTALHPWLLAYFRRRLRGSDGEDLVQMTLLSLHEKRHTYDSDAPFLPWIAAVARHKLIDYVRKNSRHVHVELTEALGLDDGMQPDMAARDVAVLLRQLPKDQARIITLQKIDGLSVDEVSRLTGKSAASVKVIVHRGLKRLRGFVGTRAEEAGDE
ncbi:sigma-70 family RNA polymerase sigma factor [Asticcacaulis sp. EMRT-3]|uniref:sigma-70 family RNA polymerase sigma factor n=1 Tax=Asticcacaulis sp. EMRT-3 TaxID=3040349 RepID=UPI0024AF9A21|nr:sigma-70 family RNA polymerase sigma factor [Asticcacaulis sp. EMRT-3]MDI7776324.1 sigma-70 family RNA polymerase sigma factor [Asticcacaulis sp. EMRT-3]